MSARHSVWVPVQFGVGDKPSELAVSYDISGTGIRISVARPVEVGAEIDITFRLLPDEPAERTVRGKIIRVERNADDPYGLWPYRMAVAFEEPMPELEGALEKAVEELDG